MSRKKLVLLILALGIVLISGCVGGEDLLPRGIFQAEMPIETKLNLGAREIIPLYISQFESEIDLNTYEVEIAIKPEGGPVEFVRFIPDDAPFVEVMDEKVDKYRASHSLTTNIVDQKDAFEIECVASGEATVTARVVTRKGEDNASMLVICENGVEVEGDEPVSDESARVPEEVDIVVDVFDFSCRPTFDENNELAGRTPGFQALFSFDHPDADQLLDAEMTVVVTDPEGKTGTVVMTIQKDTGSGEPIGHFSFYDPELNPGIYMWEIRGIETSSGGSVNVSSNDSGEFEIQEERINGCKL